MKTFTAVEMSNHPQKVYRAADKDGAVKINHGQYDDIVFILTSRKRREDTDRDEFGLELPTSG